MPRFDEQALAELRRRLDYEAVFGEHVELHGRGAERTARCIFHEDTRPSMSVNVTEGLYCCHNPECGARGDVFDFYRRVRSLTFPEAVAELARRAGMTLEDRPRTVEPPTPEQMESVLAGYQPPAPRVAELETPRTIDEAIVTAAHDRLVATRDAMELLGTRRGLTRDTIDCWMLGHDGQRFYIPIRDETGFCVNIRRYAPNAARAQDKMISWRTGFGQARLWPLDSLTGDGPIVLLEGEMDCLLGLQVGLRAITTTGGAGTWRDIWTPLFADQDVVICYDCDEAGRVGSRHIATQLLGVARSVKVVALPLAEPVGADFTDFIVGHGHSVEDFRRLITETPVFAPEPMTRGERDHREPTTMHLSEASKAEHYNAPVRVSVMVSGKTTAPYLVPKDIQLSCGMPGLRMCQRCPVGERGGMLRHEIEFESNDILQFVNVPDDKLKRLVKQKSGVPVKCNYVELMVAEAMNVEEVQLIPEIERSEADAPYVTRNAFFIGHGLQANRSYLMTGVTVPEPKRQLVTHLIHAAIPSQSNIDAFRLTEDVVSRLRAFSPPAWTMATMRRHLNTIYEDLESVTRIYQRRDLMLVVDLVMQSILQFSFQGERLVRGWTEALILGDSRTGKTTVVSRMLEHYGAGELASGENTSLAGLIGGLHQIGTSWALQWGRIPLNDRRAVVIDEAGNLPPEQIARLSSMRSSGIAEVIKVHTERTNSRTRQIWISNPRGNKPISSYSQGVLAVKELIGAPEDIARFDMVVSAASDDVTLAVINAERIGQEPAVFTRELCHQRVMWAWSRTAEQVVWEDGAERKVLELAMVHGDRYRYATEIPLVEPNEQRVKIARLAVAVAATFFSASEDGSQVIVRIPHVEFAAAFLDELYAKPSLSFREYATMQRRRYEVQEGGSIEAIIGREGNAARALMEQEQFTQRDLAEILGYAERDELREAVTRLREAGFLRRQGSSFYLKTPAAIRWLRQRLNGRRTVVDSTMDEEPEEPAPTSAPTDDDDGVSPF